MKPWYIAIRAFAPDHKDWSRYIEESGMKHIREIISIDQVLCPSAIRRFEQEDWKHNVPGHFFSDYFLDLEYLLKRTKGFESTHILRVIQNPTREVRDLFSDLKFRFLGYDLTDSYGSVSALTNCGPLPLAFSPRDLSPVGLIYTYKRAVEVQQALEHNYTDEFADSLMWAIWQKVA